MLACGPFPSSDNTIDVDMFEYTLDLEFDQLAVIYMSKQTI